MKSKINTLVIIIGGTLVVLALLWFARDSHRPYAVSLTGNEGDVLVGHWTVDGIRREVRAVLPTNFPSQGRSLEFELVRQGSSNVFKLSLTSPAVPADSISCESDYGIRGEILWSAGQEKRRVSSFSR